MKEIIATSMNYTPIGRVESVTLYYKGGDMNKILLPLKNPIKNITHSELRDRLLIANYIKPH